MGNTWQTSVPSLINAAGTLTELGGTAVWPEAISAMRAVSGSFLDFDAYQREAGEHIASILGVQAALVSSGAAAGLIQAAAACMAGEDVEARRSLPNQASKDQIVIMRTHRNPYDQALRVAGAQLVEIGSAIETDPAELEESINKQTAAVAYFLQSEMFAGSLTLDRTLEIAHAKQVPVIVDAAAELPPKKNLWDLAQRGCDLVLFSGGKEIRGPQTSGLMVGKASYIAAARFHSAPNDGIARPLKTGKEIVAGMVAALECYLAEDESARSESWERMAQDALAGLGELPGYHISRYRPNQPRVQPAIVPRVRVQSESGKLDIRSVARRFLENDPPIAVDFDETGLIFNMHMLAPEQLPEVLEAARRILGAERDNW